MSPSGAVAGGKQPAVARGDGQDLDVFADDGAGARQVGVVEGILERGQRLVFVVAVDGDLGDQGVQLGVGLLGWADGGIGSFIDGSQAAGSSLSRASGGQRTSPLLKRPIGRCTQTVAERSSRSTTVP